MRSRRPASTLPPDEGTSTDIFVMFGSDFDRPGLLPPSNYNIGSSPEPQPLFSPRQIRRPIHRPQNIVRRHTPIERCSQPREVFLADKPVNFLIVNHKR